MPFLSCWKFPKSHASAIQWDNSACRWSNHGISKTSEWVHVTYARTWNTMHFTLPACQNETYTESWSQTMGIVGPCFSCAKEHSGINSHGRNQDFQHWILSLFSRCCAIDPIRRRHDGRSMLFFQPARSENDQNGTTIEVRIKSPGCWFQPLAWILTLLSGINCLVSIV